MNTFFDSARTALELITTLNPGLWSIVGRSLAVSATACLIGCAMGVLCGAWLGVAHFRGRGAVLTLLNTLLALPSVVVGLLNALMAGLRAWRKDHLERGQAGLRGWVA